MTHIATVRDAEGIHHRCFVKLAPIHEGEVVVAEVLGHLFVKALNLPHPKFAGILLVPLNKLQAAGVPVEASLQGYPFWPAFCIEAVENSGRPIMTKNFLTSFFHDRMFKKDDVKRIAAMDEWMDNPDRHFCNIVRTRDGEFLPIDHGHLLQSLLNQPLIKPTTLITEAKRLLCLGDYDEFLSAVAGWGDAHAAALAELYVGLPKTVGAAAINLEPEALSEDILGFLTERVGDGWLANRLGLI